MEKEVITEHPSFGVVRVSRVNRGGTGTKLFMSDVKHRSFIALSISSARHRRNSRYDSAFGHKRLAEVWMSEAQFAQMITTPNSGEGAPCTLRYIDGERCPDTPATTPLSEQFKADTDSHIQGLTHIVSEARDMVDELIGGVTKPTKANMKTQAETLDHLKLELTSNLRYLDTCMRERVEELLSSAKTEFDAWVDHSLAARGLEDARQLSPTMMLTEETPALPAKVEDGNNSEG